MSATEDFMRDAARDYWQPGQLEAVNACPGCASSSKESAHVGLQDHLQHVPGYWNFVRCLGCGSLFLNPRPTPSAIGKAYAAGYFTHEPGAVRNAVDNGASLAWRLANGYLNARFGCARQPASAAGRWLVPLVVPIRQQLDYFYRHLPRTPGALLDVGCGNGAFLLRAAEAGWDVQGVEPDPVAADQAIAAGLRVHQGAIGSFSAGPDFDVITLSHVFEHLHEPGAVLSACRNMLRPGGRLWMALPNMEGVGHRHYGTAWFPLDPPRHLFLPSRRELVRLCRAAGFSKVQFLRRGRIGKNTVRECASRAEHLGIAAGPAGLWQAVMNVVSISSPNLSEEFLVVASRDGT